MTLFILLSDEEKAEMGWSGWNTPADDELEAKERKILREWHEQIHERIKRSHSSQE
jgi:hypothetical protein